MNTTDEKRGAIGVDRVVPVLVWSGLGFCAAAATLYDLHDWMFGW